MRDITLSEALKSPEAELHQLFHRAAETAQHSETSRRSAVRVMRNVRRAVAIKRRRGFGGPVH